MMKLFAPFAFAAAALAPSLQAADPVKPAPSPAQIVEAAPAEEWVKIAAADLLVMELAPDTAGLARRVVIQLLPPPFSQGWVGNLRQLAAAHWWDGLSVYRVQDNYVAQWGDAEGEDKAKARALPAGLAVVPQSKYVRRFDRFEEELVRQNPNLKTLDLTRIFVDSYGQSLFLFGWPYSIKSPIPDVPVNQTLAPTHCYGMVGVARDLSPDTGTGAELYAVIGHAPRHLDRNIALVGRVIEGIEHLSSLPRGPAPMGVYADPAGRTPIRTVRLGNEVSGLAVYEYLSTESPSFARYADARANRRDPFFIVAAGGADICNIPVPVRRVMR